MKKEFIPPKFVWKERFASKHPALCHYGNFALFHFLSMGFLGILAYCIGNVFFYSPANSSLLGQINGVGLPTLTLKPGEINPYAINISYLSIVVYIFAFVVKNRGRYAENKNLAMLTFVFALGVMLLRTAVFNYGHFDFNPIARNVDASGHDLVYAGIFAYALIVRLYQKPTLKGMFVTFGLVMFSVAVCESMFNLAYYIFLIPNDLLRYEIAYSGIATYGNLALLLVSLFLPLYFKIWKVLNKKWMLASVASFGVFLIIWIMIGFPITVDSVIGLTKWYHDIFVNSWEILSWYVYLIPATLAYLFSKIPFREYKEDVLF